MDRLAPDVSLANGMGMTDTEILDVLGPIGRACHTLVLVPVKKDKQE